MVDAIILAGGSGKRLGLDIPKALVPIDGETLIDKQIKWLKSYGIKNIILAEGFRNEQIQKHLGNSVIHSVEKEPLGTAGAINLARQHTSGNFIALNVDDLTDINLRKLMSKGPNTISLTQMRSPFGVVHTSGDYISEFEEKPILKNVWVSCGIYFLSQDIPLPKSGSIEKDVFPKTKLKHYKHYGYWNTFNTQKDIEEYTKWNKEKK